MPLIDFTKDQLSIIETSLEASLKYADIWENKLSNDYFEIDCDGYEYTYGHIFKKEV